MFGNVTTLVGWIYIGEIQEQKHAAHMLQACGLGSSHLRQNREALLDAQRFRVGHARGLL